MKKQIGKKNTYNEGRKVMNGGGIMSERVNQPLLYLGGEGRRRQSMNFDLI